MDKAILKLEHDVATFITSDSGCTVHFEYTADLADKGSYKKVGPECDITVSAITVNPKSEETFLLRKETASTKEKALKKLLDYVKSQKGLNSFTVIWMKRGDVINRNTSYFYCHDVLDVVEKFFYGKNSVDYIVFEIKLNPIA